MKNSLAEVTLFSIQIQVNRVIANDVSFERISEDYMYKIPKKKKKMKDYFI